MFIICFILLVCILIVIYYIKNINNDNYIYTTKGTKKLIVKKSKIPNAGLGCYANKVFKKGNIVGQYLGKKYIDSTIRDSSKTWFIHNHILNGRKYNKISIDGLDNTKYNPLIYTNGASLKEQFDNINCSVVWKNGNCYYKAITDIKQGDELLIDYGKQYFTARNMPYEKHV